MLSTQLNDAHFIVIASFDSREEITVYSIYCYAACGCVFKNGVRTCLFLFLEGTREYMQEQSISYNGRYFLEYNYIQISA